MLNFGSDLIFAFHMGDFHFHQRKSLKQYVNF